MKMLGGYEWARAEHFILTILFSLFFLVHIIQVIIAGWNNFREMIAGFEVVNPTLQNKNLTTAEPASDNEIIQDDSL